MIVDLPREIGWSSQRTATKAAAEARRRYEAGEPAWDPCPMCWQQGVAVQREEDGTWTVLRCGTCLGVGEVLR